MESRKLPVDFFQIAQKRKVFQSFALLMTARATSRYSFVARFRMPLRIFQRILFYAFSWLPEYRENFLDFCNPSFFTPDLFLFESSALFWQSSQDRSKLLSSRFDFFLSGFFSTFYDLGGTIQNPDLIFQLVSFPIPQTISILLQHNVNFHVCDKYGRNPLHIACEHGHKGVVTLLTKKGISFIAHDHQDQTPLFVALKNNHMDVCQYFFRLTESLPQPKSNFKLLPGEIELLVMPKIAYFPVSFNSDLSREGTLIITNFRLYIEGLVVSVQEWKNKELYIPLMCLSQIKKLKKDKGIKLVCKDFRSPTVVFENQEKTDTIYNLLKSLIYPEEQTSFFAFKYAPHFSFPVDVDGWDVYDREAEIRRIFKVSHVQKMEEFGWKLSHFNRNFQFCPSYPPSFVIPTGTEDENLLEIATFRSGARIPVFCWFDHLTSASITRSSQPQVGRTGRERSLSDEGHIHRIVTLTKSRKMCIVDARPRLNAVANQANGGGFETASVYGCDIEFLDIQNIHVVRESYEKLKKAIVKSSSSSNFFTQIGDSKWLEHVSGILLGAVKVARYIRGGTSVLVHCSDGWDRTSQLVALAEIILDPFYRTVRGFEILVEKEWCAMGHKFDQRIGHGSKNISDSQRAPIFLQFLDCVYQIVAQYPGSFEFNELMLNQIWEAVHSCRFGTFLYDTEKDRQENARGFTNFTSRVRSTVSLWSYINRNIASFLNPQYIEDTDFLFPRTDLRFMNLWKSNYFKHVDGGYIREPDPIAEIFALKRHALTKIKAFEMQLEAQLKIRQFELNPSHPSNAEIVTSRQNHTDSEQQFITKMTTFLEQEGSPVLNSKSRLHRPTSPLPNSTNGGSAQDSKTTSPISFTSAQTTISQASYLANPQLSSSGNRPISPPPNGPTSPVLSSYSYERKQTTNGSNTNRHAIKLDRDELDFDEQSWPIDSSSQKMPSSLTEKFQEELRNPDDNDIESSKPEKQRPQVPTTQKPPLPVKPLPQSAAPPPPRKPIPLSKE